MCSQPVLLCLLNNVQNNQFVTYNRKFVTHLSLQLQGEEKKKPNTLKPTPIREQRGTLLQNYHNPFPLIWKMTSLVHFNWDWKEQAIQLPVECSVQNPLKLIGILPQSHNLSTWHTKVWKGVLKPWSHDQPTKCIDTKHIDTEQLREAGTSSQCKSFHKKSEITFKTILLTSKENGVWLRCHSRIFNTNLRLKLHT